MRMFSTNEKSQNLVRERLESLQAKYAILASTNPNQLRSLIPLQEIWRFFVDGERQCVNIPALIQCFSPNCGPFRYHSLNQAKAAKLIINDTVFERVIQYLCLTPQDLDNITIIELLSYNFGWFFFERSEPGYLKSLYMAFDLLFRKQKKLNLDFICTLHRMATTQTQNMRYDQSKNTNLRGETRNSKTPMIGFRIQANTASRQGLTEFFKRAEQYPWLSIGINQEICLRDLKDRMRYSELNVKVDKFRLGQPVLYKALTESRNYAELGSAIMDCITQGVHIQCISRFSAGHVAIELRKHALSFIERFNKTIIRNISPLEKLRAIVRLVQDLEQLHMFDDGNCRTLCMLLLNHLLINHDFPLCILQNPNGFDALSEDELIEQVIAGMENTFILIRKGKLFDVDTSNLIKLSKTNNAFGINEWYFDAIIGIEKAARIAKQEQDKPDAWEESEEIRPRKRRCL